MISESSFQNRSLSRALYEAALERLCASLAETFGAEEFARCHFGIAPGADRQNTLFVVTESRSQVERLSCCIATISAEVERLLPGVARIALCVRPAGDPDAECPPRNLAGRIFELRSSPRDRAV
ncbi:MAG: hypothetical protein ACFB9N_18630 [Geitlerinemataceae cyanobacterium]